MLSGAPLAEAIAAAYVDACRAELAALKPGNVHIFAAGHRMTVADFAASAAASAGPLTQAASPVGRRIRLAVEATRASVGRNTNLGIILLAAPLAAAAERGGGLRAALADVLRRLDRDDTENVNAAIRLAAPAGLGRAEAHDVHDEAIAALREVMQAAAGRDRIARAYVTGFDEVFDIGLPTLDACRRDGLAEAWCVTGVYMALLSRLADSHIARKYGPAVAERVRRRAEEVSRQVVLGRQAFEPLKAFDQRLKRKRINPGTSADFTVATLFADGLRQFVL
jgi:triphosphoribosyl-dephospho-CoA synthase